MPPRFADHPDHAATVIERVLEATDPALLVDDALQAEPLSPRPAFPIAVGKAALKMARGLRPRLPARSERMLLLVPDAPATASAAGPATTPSGAAASGPASTDAARIIAADHPLPTKRNVVAGMMVEQAVEGFAASNRFADAYQLVALLSGGASALACVPAEGLTIEDLAALTAALLHAGAGIEELNTVRKHCERLKGGQLARLAAGGVVRVLTLSDVPGQDPSTIASGPFAPDPTTFGDALAVLDRFDLAPRLPAVAEHLRRGIAGDHPETPKPGDPLFANIRTTLVGSNALAVHAAARALERLGFAVRPPRLEVRGSAEAFGRSLAQDALALQPGEAIVAGGETTVRLPEFPGHGGRNQHAALAAALELDGARGACLVTFATDGADGVAPPGLPPAAGAIVSGQTVRLAAALGLDPAAHLARADAYPLFARLHAAGSTCHVVTGPTGTNVCDIAVALRY